MAVLPTVNAVVTETMTAETVVSTAARKEADRDHATTEPEAAPSQGAPRSNKGSKSLAAVDSVHVLAPASDIVAAIQPLTALPALSVVLPIPVRTDLVPSDVQPPISTYPTDYLSCNIYLSVNFVDIGIIFK